MVPIRFPAYAVTATLIFVQGALAAEPDLTGTVDYPPVDVAWLLNRESALIQVVVPAGDAETTDSTNPEAWDVPSVPAAEPDAEQASQAADLFRPLRDVTAHGSSSSPPQLADIPDVGDLEHPQDVSGLWESRMIPAYYVTSGSGVYRAPRNTHCFYAHPLWFEDPNLERCGRTHGGLTNTCSALRFAAQAVVSPVLMLRHDPDACVSMLPDCPTCHRFPADASCPR